MFKVLFPRATRAALIAIALTSVARADELPEITVTADRIEEPIGQTGASVTIIPGAEVAKLGTKGLADVLRGVAGLDVDEAGGVGAVTEVRLRGSNPGETLVLIDGVRIGDPSATDGSLEFRQSLRRRHRAHRGAARAAVGALLRSTQRIVPVLPLFCRTLRALPRLSDLLVYGAPVSIPVFAELVSFVVFTESGTPFAGGCQLVR